MDAAALLTVAAEPHPAGRGRPLVASAAASADYGLPDCAPADWTVLALVHAPPRLHQTDDSIRLCQTTLPLHMALLILAERTRSMAC